MNSGSEERDRLEATFRRFEELPARGAFDEKRDLIRDIVSALARHSAGARTQEHDRMSDAAARLQMLSPGAPDHDEVALELIDAARDHLADGHDHGGRDAAQAPEPPGVATASAADAGSEDERVDQASDESFPASDPPSYAADPERDRS